MSFVLVRSGVALAVAGALAGVASGGGHHQPTRP